jgi:hypothetical protein
VQTQSDRIERGFLGNPQYDKIPAAGVLPLLAFGTGSPARGGKPGCEGIRNESETASIERIREPTDIRFLAWIWADQHLTPSRKRVFSAWADRRSLVLRCCGFLDAHFGRVFCISARLVRHQFCGALDRGQRRASLPREGPFDPPTPLRESPAALGFGHVRNPRGPLPFNPDQNTAA